ncbi:hypothetical protein E2C01_082954 [Portunus trituberculatus]|uniref:Uncharacterized protein n=1 Tax=Portunus trituberculatus TaxID=210409 RepID=A0A5B7J6H5_PORTR|nr:hypothetical protein [Portunus trituberculatus]
MSARMEKWETQEEEEEEEEEEQEEVVEKEKTLVIIQCSPHDRKPSLHQMARWSPSVPTAARVHFMCVYLHSFLPLANEHLRAV